MTRSIAKLWAPSRVIPISQLVSDVRASLENDPAASSVIEVVFLYPGFHALLLHRIAHSLHNFGLSFWARLISQVGRFLTGVEIHPAATIGKGVFIDHGMGVVIGETAEIGDDVLLYHGVTLGSKSADPDKRHPTIKDGVTLGAQSTLLGPITIGANATVGAGAVVTKSVSPDETVVGVPADRKLDNFCGALEGTSDVKTKSFKHGNEATNNNRSAFRQL